MQRDDQQIYERLLRLPLFQGMSREVLTEMSGHTRLEFGRFAAGDVVYTEDAPCTAMTFLLRGSMVITSHSDDHSYRVEEILTAPALLPPEFLFGLIQRYAHTFTASTDCEILRLGKAEVVRLLERNDIFRINLLNIIATRVQRLSRQAWHPHPLSIRQKICRFLREHCLHPAGEKMFYIKMEQLATHIGESRLNVSRELHAMERDGLLDHARGNLHVKAMETMAAES